MYREGLSTLSSEGLQLKGVGILGKFTVGGSGLSGIRTGEGGVMMGPEGAVRLTLLFNGGVNFCSGNEGGDEIVCYGNGDGDWINRGVRD